MCPFCIATSTAVSLAAITTTSGALIACIAPKLRTATAQGQKPDTRSVNQTQGAEA